MMPVKARILGGNDSVLEIGRDSAKRNEFVPFLIRRVLKPGLQSALDVHRGCRWVDPSDGNKQQRRKRPKKQRADDKPSNQRPEETLPNWRLSG